MKKLVLKSGVTIKIDNEDAKQLATELVKIHPQKMFSLRFNDQSVALLVNTAEVAAIH